MSSDQYRAHLAANKPRAKADGGIVGPLIRQLNQIPGCFAFRVQCGRVRIGDNWIHLAPAGTPDIFGTINNRPFALECKCATGTPSAVQLRMHERLRRCGVRVGIPRTVGEGVRFVVTQ